MNFDELVAEAKRRRTVVKAMWKPYASIFWLLSIAGSIYGLFKDYGKLTLPLLGLVGLTFVLLYYAAGDSRIRLFARRALALFIDLSLICVALFMSISLYSAEVDRPEDILQIQFGEVLMLALWLAFLYFVIFDWRFKGTLGKRLVRLTVTGVGKEGVSFCRSFICTFLSFPLPMIVAGYLDLWLVGGSPSPVRAFAGDASKNVLLSFVPLSVLVFEGNQSIADRLTRIVVRAEHGAVSVLPRIRLKTWILLSTFSLAWAVLLAGLVYLAFWKPLLNGASKPMPKGGTATWMVKDPRTTGALWMILPIGLRQPMYGIRNIDLLVSSPNPFTFQAKDSPFLTRLDPGPYLKDLHQIHIVRVTLAREYPLQVKLFVVQNFLSFVSQRTPMEARPSFSLLQIATEKSFGLFSIDQHENILICFMASGDKPLDFYTDVRPHGTVSFPVSLDQTAYLLVGAGIAYWY